VREGVVNTYAMNFLVPVPAHISELEFSWQSLTKHPVSTYMEHRSEVKLRGMSLCMHVRGKMITLCACQGGFRGRDGFLTIMPVITLCNAVQTFLLTWPEFHIFKNIPYIYIQVTQKERMFFKYYYPFQKHCSFYYPFKKHAFLFNTHFKNMRSFYYQF
jgi:hypothetical protein